MSLGLAPKSKLEICFQISLQFFYYLKSMVASTVFVSYIILNFYLLTPASTLTKAFHRDYLNYDIILNNKFSIPKQYSFKTV